MSQIQHVFTIATFLKQNQYTCTVCKLHIQYVSHVCTVISFFIFFIYFFIPPIPKWYTVMRLKRRNTGSNKITGKIYRGKKTHKTEIITLKLNSIVYWKERRGAHLDKLILCPLKLCITKVWSFLIKSKRTMKKITK